MKGLVLILFASVAAAQPVVAPTPDRPDQIETFGGYTVSNSFEFGHRFVEVAGSDEAYRASVNFGNGVRLLAGELRVDSLGGQAKLFDELSFRSNGAVGDPYQSYVLRVEKNALYRYDMRARQVRYNNQLPALWAGERGVDSERFLQTHDLTLSPGGRLEVFLGFDRNKLTGPGFLTEGIPQTVGAFDRERFLRFRTDLRQVNNQYRAGATFRAAGLAVTVMQFLDNYKEDTRFADASALPGALENLQPVESARRDEPFHGNTPVTSLALRTERENRFGFHGRLVYSGGERNSVLSQDVTAVNPSSNASSRRQTFILGTARRSQATGDFTATVAPSDKWTLTNTTSFNNLKIDGDAAFLEITAFEDRMVEFESLGIRHVSNSAEVQFRPTAKIGLFAAHRFSTRRTLSRDSRDVFGISFPREVVEINNDVHSGAGGLRWLPVKGVRASFDFEIGRADRPLTPQSDRKFHRETARFQWRGRGATLAAHFINSVNNNPASLVDSDRSSRSYGVRGSWIDPAGRFLIDGGYTRLRIDAEAQIFNLFTADDPDAPAMGRSFFLSRMNTLNFGGRWIAAKRLTIYLGYTLAKDTADGRARLAVAGDLDSTYPNFAFDGVNFFNSFPLTYQSAQGRLSASLSDKLSLNFGYQFYNYSEKFAGLQNFNAHTGYSSLRWSF